MKGRIAATFPSTLIYKNKIAKLALRIKLLSKSKCNYTITVLMLVAVNVNNSAAKYDVISKLFKTERDYHY